MKKFSDRLRYTRLQRGYTQVELAHRAGLSQSAVASYESDKRQSSRAIFKLAIALGVDAQWLDTGNGPMVSTEETSDNTAPSIFRETSGNLSKSTPPAITNEWPFFNIPRRHYDNLTAHHKQFLERLMELYIEAYQNAPVDR